MKLVVEQPAVAPARGGLLSIVDVMSAVPVYGTTDGYTHDAVLLGHNRRVPAPGTDKTFDKSIQVEGPQFKVYRGIDSAILLNEDAPALVQEAFGLGETVGVEQAIQELVLNPAADDITPTPGTPVTNLRQAVGLLEQYIGERYAGLPILHGNRYAVSLMRDLKVDGDWKLTTKQGTPVANGAGYGVEGPGTAGAGEAWLYISGQLNIWRSTLNVVEAPDLEDNRKYALAEAVYNATVEGPVAAILVGI